MSAKQCLYSSSFAAPFRRFESQTLPTSLGRELQELQEDGSSDVNMSTQKVSLTSSHTSHASYRNPCPQGNPKRNATFRRWRLSSSTSVRCRFSNGSWPSEIVRQVPEFVVHVHVAFAGQSSASSSRSPCARSRAEYSRRRCLPGRRLFVKGRLCEAVGRQVLASPAAASHSRPCARWSGAVRSMSRPCAFASMRRGRASKGGDVATRWGMRTGGASRYSRGSASACCGAAARGWQSGSC